MVRRLALLVLLSGLLAACGGGTASETAGPTETTAPGGTSGPATGATETAATTETDAETQPPAETTTLAVYFLRGEKIGVAHRYVPKTEAVGRAALEELLGGPTAAEAEAGLGSGIPPGTELLGLAIADGVATVDLSGEYASGGGSLAMFTRLAQVVYTLTQFPTVEGVVFRLDGEPVETFSSEGIVLDHPQTRADYEDQTPPTLVESPAVGDTVASPLRLAGTSNVFEATSNYELLDAGGQVIAEGFVTATCGTGCRGTFETTISFEWSGDPRGSLVVFETSAADGSRINAVEIPLGLVPTPCCA